MNKILVIIIFFINLITCISCTDIEPEIKIKDTIDTLYNDSITTNNIKFLGSD